MSDNNAPTAAQQQESIKNMAKQGRLNSRPELQMILNQYRSLFLDLDSLGLPRFGLISLLAEGTPMFVYDHESLMEQVSTAFAIPGAIFISAPMFELLLLEDKESKSSSNKSDNVLFILTHEFQHIVRNHFMRCKQFTPKIANIGEDIRINIDNVVSFELTPGKALTEKIGGWGLTPEEANKFNGMPEELICLILNEEADKQAKEREQNQNGQSQNGQSQDGQSQDGQSQDGQSQDGQAQDGQSQDGQSQDGQSQDGQAQDGQAQDGQSQDGQSQDGQSQDGQAQGSKPKYTTSPSSKVPQHSNYENLDLKLAGPVEPEENHTMSMGDFIDTLKKNGLDSVLEKLGLPKDPTAKDLEKMEQEFENAILDSYNKADNIRKTNPNGDKMAGGHIEDAVGYLIGELNKPRLNIKSVIREAIEGDGLAYRTNNDMPTELYHVDPAAMGLEYPIFEAAIEPAEQRCLPTIILVDTSGSIYSDKDTMREFFSEAVGILEENENAQVYVFCADTAVRGKPVMLSKDNLDECINELEVIGSGGTEFTGPINTAINWVKENVEVEINGIYQEVEIGAILYMTDLEASPPSKANLVDDLPPVMFICRDSDYNPNFADSVSEYAEVHRLGDSSEIDLNEKYDELEEKESLTSMSM
ncbi:MAG: hypothetical protein HAW67_06930 [Endozoicomonadaceae bacterium]|nr:hypothetical protein [Endozoicomonadaceae bacterium]